MADQADFLLEVERFNSDKGVARSMLNAEVNRLIADGGDGSLLEALLRFCPVRMCRERLPLNDIEYWRLLWVESELYDPDAAICRKLEAAILAGEFGPDFDPVAASLNSNIDPASALIGYSLLAFGLHPDQVRDADGCKVAIGEFDDFRFAIWYYGALRGSENFFADWWSSDDEPALERFYRMGGPGHGYRGSRSLPKSDRFGNRWPARPGGGR